MNNYERLPRPSPEGLAMTPLFVIARSASDEAIPSERLLRFTRNDKGGGGCVTNHMKEQGLDKWRIYVIVVRSCPLTGCDIIYSEGGDVNGNSPKGEN